MERRPSSWIKKISLKVHTTHKNCQFSPYQNIINILHRDKNTTKLDWNHKRPGKVKAMLDLEAPHCGHSKAMQYFLI